MASENSRRSSTKNTLDRAQVETRTAEVNFSWRLAESFFSDTTQTLEATHVSTSHLFHFPTQPDPSLMHACCLLLLLLFSSLLLKTQTKPHLLPKCFFFLSHHPLHLHQGLEFAPPLLSVFLSIPFQSTGPQLERQRVNHRPTTLGLNRLSAGLTVPHTP